MRWSGPIIYTALVFVVVVGCRGSESLQPAGLPLQSTRDPAKVVARYAYAWPVVPFRVQHPVRGFFADPRMPRPREPATYAFHFGIDIACAEGTAVYATLTGRAELLRRHAQAVRVVRAGAAHRHEYWHVTPVVRDGQPVVAYRTIVGRVVRGDVSSHLHFAEQGPEGYVNPLRLGALGPFSDRTLPTIHGVGIERGGEVLRTLPRSGRIDLVVTAFDTTPVPVVAPWDGKPVTPALIKWRPRGAGKWLISWDVRHVLPARDGFRSFYSRFTCQNSPYGRTGRYRFFIVRGVEVRTVARWRRVEVRVEDTRGNTTTRLLSLPEPA